MRNKFCNVSHLTVRACGRCQALKITLKNSIWVFNRDSGSGPAHARRAIGCHCKIKILDPGEMLKGVFMAGRSKST